MVGMVTPQHIRERNLVTELDVCGRERNASLPVGVHGGGSDRPGAIGVDRWSTRLEVHAFTHPVGR